MTSRLVWDRKKATAHHVSLPPPPRGGQMREHLDVSYVTGQTVRLCVMLVSSAAAGSCYHPPADASRAAAPLSAPFTRQVAEFGIRIMDLVSEKGEVA